MVGMSKGNFSNRRLKRIHLSLLVVPLPLLRDRLGNFNNLDRLMTRFFTSLQFVKEGVDVAGIQIY